MKNINSIFIPASSPTYRFNFSLIVLLMMLGQLVYTNTIYAQVGPCDAIRWMGNGSDAWTGPGPFDILASGDEGIVGCGSSAATQSNVGPVGTYSPGTFTITFPAGGCFSPNTGNPATVTPPVAGQDLIWIQFDVRAYAGSYDYQIVTNDNIGWVLYAATGTPAQPMPGAVPANCSGGMMPIACGDAFSNTFATSPTPVFANTTNLYLVIWDQDDGNNFSVNFKARFGCGGSDLVICSLQEMSTISACNPDGSYTVTTNVAGANGHYEVIDHTGMANSIQTTPNPLILTNLGQTNPVINGTVTVTYPVGVNYNFTVQENGDAAVPNPVNSADCSINVSGTGPASCCALDVDCPPGEDRTCNQPPPACGTPTEILAEFTRLGGTFTGQCNNVTITCADAGTICGGQITRTFTLNDGVTTVTCPVIYQFSKPPLTIQCPPGQNLGCNPPGIPAPGVATTSGGCGTANITSSLGPIIDNGCNRSQTRTYLATDDCGQTASCDQVFTWQEATTPVFANCTDGTTDLGCNPTLPTCDPNVTASNECGPVNVTCTPGQITSNGCNRTQDFVYTATACGLTATCTKTFTWQIATAPVIANCTTGTTDLGCNPTPPTCEALTASNECGPVDVSCTPGTITIDGCNRSQSFVYTATACGLTSTCTKTFTWQIATAPVIANCTTGTTDLGCNPTPPTCEALTASNECGPVDVSCTPGTITIDGCNRTQSFVYTATTCGLTSTCTKTFTWQIATAPVIANCTTGTTDLGCNPTPPTCEALTASNECGPVDVSCTPGTITIDGCNRTQSFVYTATACGLTSTCTKTFTWQIATAPVIANCTTGTTDLGCNPTPPSCEALTASNECGLVDVSCTPGTITIDGCNRTQSFVYTATACGLTSTCTKTFTWQIATAPVIANCTTGTTDLGCNPTPPTCEALTVSNECGPVDVSCTPGTITIDGCNRTQSFVYTATACGLTSTCTKTFTWQIATAPVIANCTTGTTDLGCNPTPPTCEALTASNECGPVDVSCTPGTITIDGCNRSQSFVYTATACGLTSTCTKTFTWQIATAPVIANCTTGTTDLGCNPTPPSCEALTASNECGPVDVSCTPGTITIDGCNRTQSFVYTATACGLTSTCTKTFTWQIATAPVIANCTTGTTDLGCNPTPPTCEALTASNECGPVDVSCTPGTITIDGCNRTQSFVYTATACGLTSTCTKTFTWQIATAPVIANCTTGTTDLGCNPTPPTCEALTASNECGPVDVSCTPGTITIDGCNRTQSFVYTATACGLTSTCTKTFTWKENIPLVCNKPADIANQYVNQSTLNTAFAAWKTDFSHSGGCNTVANYYVNNILVNLNALPVPDYCVGSTLTVEQRLTSDCENKSCASTFTVLAQAQAIIITIPDNDEICFRGANPPTAANLPPARSLANLLSFTVVPPCVDPGTITVSSVVTGPTISGSEYTFTRTYTLMGPNISADPIPEVFRFLWDPNPPVFEGVPANIQLSCGSTIPSWPTVTAIDPEDGPVLVQRSESTIPILCGDQLRRVWTARDNCGNIATATQIITFVDDVPPSLVVPADLTLECADPIPSPSYSASDNCSTYNVEFQETRTNVNECEFFLTRIWTARDACDNVQRDTQIITIVDNTAPVINIINPNLVGLPIGGEIIMYGCERPEVMPTDVSIVDDCCTASLATDDELLAYGVCEAFGYFARWRCSYTATDAAGNVSEFYFFVLQYDTMAPSIYNVPDDITIECGGEIPAPEPSVYMEDDCSLATIPKFTEETFYDDADSSNFTIVRTWYYVDRCGNRGEDSQVITVCEFDPTLASASVGNTVWDDLDNNGLQDEGEEGLNDIVVHLYKKMPSPTDPPQLVSSTTTSTINGKRGQFTFGHLVPDEYQIQFEAPADMEFTLPDQGTDEEIDSDANPATGMTEPIALQQQQSLMNVDAGLVIASVFPVELVSFEVEADACVANIGWTTASEIDLSHYEVQYAHDGLTFSVLEIISAKGSQTALTDYAYQDTIRMSTGYYRLKMIDLDGSCQYSAIKSFNTDCFDARKIEVYPNPFQQSFTLELISNEKAKATLMIYNSVGKLIRRQELNADPGYQLQQIDLEGMPVGTYFLQVQMNNLIRHQKLIKTN